MLCGTFWSPPHLAGEKWLGRQKWSFDGVCEKSEQNPRIRGNSDISAFDFRQEILKLETRTGYSEILLLKIP